MRRPSLGLVLGGGLVATLALAALAIALFAGAGGASGNKTMVKADPLTGYQEATPAGNSSAGSGTFEATIDEGASPPTITYTLTYVGLSGPALFSHIHFGNRYDSGGISAFLCGGGSKPPCPPGTTTEATVTGTITPADVIGPVSQGILPGQFDKLVGAIRSGVTYVNVHTPMFPAGEIRGQINNDDQRQVP
jgi:CHRD domain-containing protein